MSPFFLAQRFCFFPNVTRDIINGRLLNFPLQGLPYSDDGNRCCRWITNPQTAERDHAPSGLLGWRREVFASIRSINIVSMYAILYCSYENIIYGFYRDLRFDIINIKARCIKVVIYLYKLYAIIGRYRYRYLPAVVYANIRLSWFVIYDCIYLHLMV